MGVTGLWRLIEPTGKPVPVEVLENKVLAVDISIWLHQMVKGYQDAKGAPLPNAHLIGLFQRLCKLLYFRIKPVFVFDGGFPELKKETIGKRQVNKAKYNSQSERLKREIAFLLGKKTAIGSLLGKQISPKKNNTVDNNDDIFKLPALPEKDEESESESEDERSSSASSLDLHSVDLESDKFKNLTAKEKYDLLVDLKETRKMNSWGKLHTLPKKSDNFSDFQMQRLLKRRKLQECLQETEKEMGEGSMSLNELESLLNEEGIQTKIESLPSRRIASNESTRYVLIKSVKEALAEAKKKEEMKTAKQEEMKTVKQAIKDSCEKNNTDSKQSSSKGDELEDDLQKAIKMSLECVDENDTSACTFKTDDSWTSNLSDSDFSDSEDDDGFVETDMSSAKAYIMQYSDFTDGAINDIVKSKQNVKKTCKALKVDKIIEELNNEKSIIEERVDLSSSEDNLTNNTSYQINKETNDTEASIICVEKNNEIILLDTSIEDIENCAKEHNEQKFNEQNSEKVSESKDKLFSTIGTFETKEIYTSQDKTQESVVHVGKEDEIILLDEWVEEKGNKTFADNQSDSSEGEFEEVSETEGKFKIPIVQFTLNMNEKLEDDIFADIFNENTKKEVINQEQENNTSKVITITNNINDKESFITNAKKESFQEKKSVINHEKNVTVHQEVAHERNTSQEVSNERNTHQDAQKNTNITETQDKEPNNRILKDKLNSMVSEIEDKEDDLVHEKARLDRVGRNITEQMTKEAQELLQIFGIPYIIAPMEAEAQCAFLESVKLTDGTITDDSDIWLFGGQTVYKNFFNQKKHVLQYLNEKIEKSFNLSREQLVLLALLVGSDYTPGISGVGPVTALEILASFPFNKRKLSNEQSKQEQYQEIINGLIDFKKWVKAGKRTDNVTLKKKLKNIKLNDDFPSIRVVQAYFEPNVERSEDKFTWGNLDITILRDYTKAKFGWSQNKFDEIIKPVLKRMEDRKNQKTVHDYFKRKTDFQSLEDQMSKRVKAAVQKMGPRESVSSNENKPKKIRKRKLPTSKTTSNIEDSGNSAGTVHSAPKQRKDSDNINTIPQVLKAQELLDKELKFEINVSKTQMLQDIIPQREKDKQSMLQNKLKAIEAFRKTKIDRKTRTTKRRLPKPKDDAELSESSDSN